MQWTPGTAMDNWAKLGLAARGLKALGNGSVFLFLLLPLVALNNCGGTVATFTGYQALQETLVPTTYMEPVVYIPYGPDWWVVGVMVFAAAGIGSAWRGGIPRSLIGGALAIGGLIVLNAAIGFFNPPNGIEYWSPQPGKGGLATGFAFASVIVFELASIAARGWSEAKRSGASRGDWTAMGCLATIVAVILGLIVLVLAVLTLATGHGQP
jgi:hypothetical protein